MKDFRLSFAGRGSAFNEKLGDNSAFYRKGDSIMVIDCGGATFGLLKSSGALDGIKKMYILITHLHPDHVGSLGNLIYYACFKLKAEIVLVYPTISGLTKLKIMLDIQGVEYGKHYTQAYHFDRGFLEGVNVEYRAVETEHWDGMDCFGYMFANGVWGDTLIYYSGDAKTVPDAVMEHLDKFDVIYQDVSSKGFDGNPHITIDELQNLIPRHQRTRVWLMHLDEEFDVPNAKWSGFNVVEGYGGEG